MRVRSRVVERAEQWNGTNEEAQRLGLVLLSVAYLQDYRAWHLSTFDGPRAVRTGDWLVGEGRARRIYSAADFQTVFESAANEEA